MTLYIGNTGSDPSEVDNRLNSLFENSDPQTFRAQETSPSPSVDTEQNCPQKQRRSSVITTLKEASEGISIQPPQIQSKESENIYSTKEDTCQVLADVFPVAETHSASVDSQFQVIQCNTCILIPISILMKLSSFRMAIILFHSLTVSPSGFMSPRFFMTPLSHPKPLRTLVSTRPTRLTRGWSTYSRIKKSLSRKRTSRLRNKI